ncbi:hypothetical protein [Candidatus Sororendozoicomonas aggregata]|uniref:hypothetical protein n=1 Tax=Candidatus Sororendozoicomonas aggregata TaxID=3073239 RepID=UPI002ED24FCF
MYCYFYPVTRWLVVYSCTLIFSALLFAAPNDTIDAIDAIYAKDKTINRVYLVNKDSYVVAICHLTGKCSVRHLLGAADGNYSNCLWSVHCLFVPDNMFVVQHGKNGRAYIHCIVSDILMSCVLEIPQQYVAYDAFIASHYTRQATSQASTQQLCIGSSQGFATPGYTSGPARSGVYTVLVEEEYWQQTEPALMANNQPAASPLYLSPYQAMADYSYATDSTFSSPDQSLACSGFTLDQNQFIDTPTIKSDDYQSLRQELSDLNKTVAMLIDNNKTLEAKTDSMATENKKAVRFDAFINTTSFLREEIASSSNQMMQSQKKEIDLLKRKLEKEQEQEQELKNPNTEFLSQQRPEKSTKNNNHTQESENKVQHVSITETPSQAEAVNTNDGMEHSCCDDSTSEINDADASAPLPKTDDNSEPAALRQHPVTKTPQTQAQEAPETTKQVGKKKKKTRKKKDTPRAETVASKTPDVRTARSLDEPRDNTTSFGAFSLQCKKTILRYPRTIVASAMVTTLLLSCYIADVDLPSVFFYLITLLHYFYEAGVAYASFNVQNGIALAQEYLLPPVVAVFGTVGAFFAAINGNCADTQKALAEHQKLLLSPTTTLHPADDYSANCPEFDYLKQYGTVPCFNEVDWQTFQKPAPEDSHIALDLGQLNLKDARCRTLKKLDRLLKRIAHAGADKKDIRRLLKQCGVIANESWAEFCYANMLKLMSCNQPVAHYIQQLAELQKKAKNNGHQPFQISARRAVGTTRDGEIFYGAALCCESQGECSLPPGTNNPFHQGLAESESCTINLDLPDTINALYTLEQFLPNKHGGVWQKIATFRQEQETLQINHGPQTGIYRVMDPEADRAVAAYCVLGGKTSAYFF